MSNNYTNNIVLKTETHSFGTTLQFGCKITGEQTYCQANSINLIGIGLIKLYSGVLYFLPKEQKIHVEIFVVLHLNLACESTYDIP